MRLFLNGDQCYDEAGPKQKEKNLLKNIGLLSQQAATTYCNKHWIKEIADLHITLPSEHRLIKDGLRMNMAIRGARAPYTVINITYNVLLLA
jgi:hypothetical protein